MGTDGTGDLVLLGRFLQGSDAGALDPIDWAQLDAVEALLSGHPQSPTTLSTSPERARCSPRPRIVWQDGRAPCDTLVANSKSPATSNTLAESVLRYALKHPTNPQNAPVPLYIDPYIYTCAKMTLHRVLDSVRRVSGAWNQWFTGPLCLQQRVLQKEVFHP